MSFVSVRTPYNIYLDFESSPLTRRIAAWVLDITVVIAFGYAGRFLILQLFKSQHYPLGIDLLLVSLPMLLYPLIMEVIFDGQTIGKMITGLRVLSIEGGEPGIGQYLMRWIFRIWEWPIVFGSMGISYFGLFAQLLVAGLVGLVVIVVIAVSNKGQRLGDLAAGTAVVNLRQRFSVDDTIFREIMPSNYKVLFPNVMMLSDRDINAIKSVIVQTRKSGRYDTAFRIAAKVKEVLQISNDDDVIDFLEKLLADYNYLATRE